MTPVFSIFEQIGLGGGGKVKSVYHRLNALAEIDGFQPILLSLNHNPNQLLNFARLKANGAIASGVQVLTLAQACHQTAIETGVKPFNNFPAFDHIKNRSKKTVYLKDGKTVMTELTKTSPIGEITKRNLSCKNKVQVFTLINGELHHQIRRYANGTLETTDYVKGLPICSKKVANGTFVVGHNLVNGEVFRKSRHFERNIFEMVASEDAVFFFDGVTSAYISGFIQGHRALFLHADHRNTNGLVPPRKKFLIEKFRGEAIITATDVQKNLIESELKPAADLHVIPYFFEHKKNRGIQRQNLVTVSRLDLKGKPIDECIKAFCQIKDDFPGVNYLIYGEGSGSPRLEALIRKLHCADRVTLEGFTTDPLSVFQNAMAAVYPTMTEGFGLSILEALSNGCPVVSYDVNYGPREMIDPGLNGELVPPGNIAAIAAALRRVLEAPEHYQRGTSRGLERYQRSAYVANYREFIQSLTRLPRTGWAINSGAERAG